MKGFCLMLALLTAVAVKNARSQQPTCADIECNNGERCKMQQVQCDTTPCDPQPVCVPFGACKLPKKVGPCKARMPKFYYNSRAKECQSFNYGGCGANANNFEDMKSCREACVDKPGACPLPKRPGDGICTNICTLDINCTGRDKCCRSACGGTTCTRAITQVTCANVNCTDAGQKCRLIIGDRDRVRAECVDPARIPNKPRRACGKIGFPLLKDAENGKLELFKTNVGCPDVWVWKGKYCCIDMGLGQGSCPRPCGINGCNPSIRQCPDKCQSDGQCKNGKKCCPSKCGGKKCAKAIRRCNVDQMGDQQDMTETGNNPAPDMK